MLSFVGYLSAGNVGLNLCIEVPIVKLVVEQVALSVVLRWQRKFVASALNRPLRSISSATSSSVTFSSAANLARISSSSSTIF